MTSPPPQGKSPSPWTVTRGTDDVTADRLSASDAAAVTFTAPTVTARTTFTVSVTVSYQGATATAAPHELNVSTYTLSEAAITGAAEISSEAQTTLTAAFQAQRDGEDITPAPGEVSFEWTVTRGTNDVTAEWQGDATDTAAATFTAPTVTTDTDYTVSVTVSYQGETATATHALKVIPKVTLNSFGIDITTSALDAIVEGETSAAIQATLTATDTSNNDVSGTLPVSYSWTSTPAGGTFSNAAALQTTFTADVAETASANVTYTLTLTATYPGQPTSTDTITIAVKPLKVTISAAASYARDGTYTVTGSQGNPPNNASSLAHSWSVATVSNGAPTLALTGKTTAQPTFATTAAMIGHSYRLTYTAALNNASQTTTHEFQVGQKSPIATLTVTLPTAALEFPQGSSTPTTLAATVTAQNADSQAITLATEITYQWRLTDSSNAAVSGRFDDATLATPVFTPPATEGSYTLHVTVDHPDWVDVSATKQKTPPTAMRTVTVTPWEVTVTPPALSAAGSEKSHFLNGRRSSSAAPLVTPPSLPPTAGPSPRKLA